MPLRGKEIWEELHLLANDCYAKGMDFDKIQKELLSRQNDEALVYAIIKKIKFEHYAELRKEGFKILAIGFAFILSGFIITCCNFHANQSIIFAMYGLTTIGIIIVFWGLYKIIG